jgi:hypothetical protein
MVESGLNDSAREKLLGHSLELNNHYFRPKQDYLLQEYLKAVDSLTIDDSQRLRRENETLKIKKSEIEQLREQVEQYKSMQPDLQSLAEEMEKLKKAFFSSVNNNK